jgi:hypothetical protein
MGATFTRGKAESKSTKVIFASTIEDLNALIAEHEENGWSAIDTHKVVETQRDTRNSIGVTIVLAEYSITMQK